MTEYNRIWQVVQRHNRASRDADVDTLRLLTHPRLVMVPPGGQQRACGQDAYVESVAEFASRGRVLDYQEHDHIIDLFDDTAMVSYRYTSVWESGGKRIEESGQDLMILLRREDEWLIAWRTLMPDPAATSG